MAKDGAMPEKEFFLDKNYMFYFKDGAVDPTVIVGKPTLVEDELLFHFMIGHKSESEFVKKEDIIAVGDNENGTVKVLGWTGKYRILNKDLFEKYLNEGVIELKDDQTYPIKIDPSMPDCDIYYDGKHFYSQGK